MDFPYREAIDSLLYLALVTRLDISFAVEQAAHFVEDHDSSRHQAVKRIISYLRDTRTPGLSFGGSATTMVVGYTDEIGQVAWSPFTQQRAVSFSPIEGRWLGTVSVNLVQLNSRWRQNTLQLARRQRKQCGFNAHYQNYSLAQNAHPHLLRSTSGRYVRRKNNVPRKLCSVRKRNNVPRACV